MWVPLTFPFSPLLLPRLTVLVNIVRFLDLCHMLHVFFVAVDLSIYLPIAALAKFLTKPLSLLAWSPRHGRLC